MSLSNSKIYFMLGALLINIPGFLYGLATNNPSLAMICVCLQYLSFMALLVSDYRILTVKIVPRPSTPEPPIPQPKIKKAPMSTNSNALCASCKNPLTAKEVEEGATLCSNCEMEESGAALIINDE